MFNFKLQNIKTKAIAINADDKTILVDGIILQKQAELTERAQANGKHFAMLGRPYATDDKIMHYILIYKSECEALVARVLDILLPGSQFPEGKIELDWAEAKKQKIHDEIKKIDEDVIISKREIGNYLPGNLENNVSVAKFISIGVFLGEVGFNMQSFEITGGSKLEALLISIFIGTVVALAAHFAGCSYKDAEVKDQEARKNVNKNNVRISALFFTVSFSTVLAILRDKLLEMNGIHIHPAFFIILNIGIFIVGAGLVWYYHPSKKEIEANKILLPKHRHMKDMERKKEQKIRELEYLNDQHKEKMQGHVRYPVKAEHTIERINRIYKAVVAEFINHNLLNRNDVFSCANDPIPELEIQTITFRSTVNKYKKT